jgi:hypothetical protein
MKPSQKNVFDDENGTSLGAAPSFQANRLAQFKTFALYCLDY